MELTHLKNDIARDDVAIELIREAVKSSLGEASLEKLMALRNQLLDEHRKNEFLIALSNFQKSCPQIPRDGVVLNKDGSVRYRYSTLDNILTNIRPILAEQGLILTFDSYYTPQHTLVVTATITHVNGFARSAQVELKIDQSQHMSDIQRYGSTLTYARRYALSLLLGLSFEDDDDAQQIATPITDDQLKKIHTLLSALSLTSRDSRISLISSLLGRQVSSSKDLSAEDADVVIDQLKKLVNDTKKGGSHDPVNNR